HLRLALHSWFSCCASLGENDVQRSFARDALGAAVAEARRIDAVEEMFAAAEEHGRDREVELVDETGRQVLADGRDAAADSHVFSWCRLLGELERGVDALG